MTNDQEVVVGQPAGPDRGGPRPPNDLAERTACFGEAVIDFSKTIARDVISLPLISQLVRCATSVGANYCEADEAVSKKEFRQKIGYCKKESRETKFWLRMVVRANPNKNEPARPLWKEAHELHLIFCAIFRNTKPDS